MRSAVTAVPRLPWACGIEAGAGMWSLERLLSSAGTVVGSRPLWPPAIGEPWLLGQLVPPGQLVRGWGRLGAAGT